MNVGNDFPELFNTIFGNFRLAKESILIKITFLWDQIDCEVVGQEGLSLS